MSVWSLQDAKNQFSEVVRKAAKEGAQIVTVRGQRAAVVLSAADYDALADKTPDPLLHGPAWDDDFVDLVNRFCSKTPSKTVEL